MSGRFSGGLRNPFGRSKNQQQPNTPSPPPIAPSGPPRPPSYPPPYTGPPTANPHLQGPGRPQSPMPPHPPYGPTNIGGIAPQISSPPMQHSVGPYGQPPGYPMAHRPNANNTPMMGRPQMSEVEGNNRGKAQLIVGIDFVSGSWLELPWNPDGKITNQEWQGTTFSGVAFAFATDQEAKEDIITEWPGAGNQTKNKIPTVLYYDQYQKVVGWGPDIADALAPTGYPKPGVQKVCLCVDGMEDDLSVADRFTYRWNGSSSNLCFLETRTLTQSTSLPCPLESRRSM